MDPAASRAPAFENGASAELLLEEGRWRRLKALLCDERDRLKGEAGLPTTKWRGALLGGRK